MGRNSKILISLISVLMIGLLVSTATTTVAAGEWGNLAVGDTMEWDTDISILTDEGTADLSFSTQMEVLEINDGTIKVKMTIAFGSSTETDDDWRPFIASQSQLAGLSTENYNYEGTNYEAAYIQITETEDNAEWTFELWYDTGSGILFEEKGTSDQGESIDIILVSTTSDLTESGGLCLGTILIALVSVTTLVSYSLIRYQKRKRT
jgi:hypothetical protein